MAGGRRPGRGFLLRPARPVTSRRHAGGIPPVSIPGTTDLDLKWSAAVTYTVPVASVTTDDEDAWSIPLEWSCLLDVDPPDDVEDV